MAQYCTSCGASYEDGAKFCTTCGAPSLSASQSNQGPEYIGQEDTPPRQTSAAPAYTAPGYGRNNNGNGANAYHFYGEDARPPKDSPYAVLGVGSYIGVMLLMMVPVVNIIMLIIWAAGGSKKHNLRNYARASLIIMAISIVLSIALFAWLFATFGYMLDEYAGLLNSL